MSGKRISQMSDAEIRTLAGQPRRQAAIERPRLVLAVDDAGNQVAIGPVITDRSVDELRSQIDAHGWTVTEVIPHLTRASFLAVRAKGIGTVQS